MPNVVVLFLPSLLLFLMARMNFLRIPMIRISKYPGVPWRIEKCDCKCCGVLLQQVDAQQKARRLFPAVIGSMHFTCEARRSASNLVKGEHTLPKVYLDRQHF